MLYYTHVAVELLNIGYDVFCFIVCAFLAAIYLLYAKLEEEHGLARHAMAVYDRATVAVLPEEQYEVRTNRTRRTLYDWGCCTCDH